jgi:hypothetical protein
MFSRTLNGRPAMVLAALFLGLLACGRTENAESQEHASTAATTTGSETPEQVTDQIITAMRNKDWAGVARLMHPEALKELRSLFDLILESQDPDDSEVRQQLFGVRTVEEAKALSDTEIFTNLMRGVLAQQGGLGDVLATAEVKILGHVQESADTVHVVYRMNMTVEEISISMMDVASMTRFGNTWRGLLKGDMRAMAAGMRQALMNRS